MTRTSTPAGLAILLLLAGVAPAQDQPQPGLDVLVVTDGPKIRQGDPWPAASAIYDATKRQVDLAGGGNEALGIQILLRSPKDKLENVSVAIAEPAGAGGATIAARNIELFREWFVDVRERSFTGDIPGLGPGEYPDPLVPVASPKYGMPFALEPGRTEVLFADLYIPAGTPAGEYRSSISIRSGDKELVKLALNVKVWKFTLPEETHFKNTFAYLTELLRWGLRNPPAERVGKMEEALFRLGHLHRANLLKFNGIKRTPTEWEAWAAKNAKYLDGTLYTDSPGKGVPNCPWSLYFDPNIPEAELKEQLARAADFLQKKGWLDRFVVACFDEPKKDKYELVQRVGKLTRELSGGRLKHFLPGARPAPAFQDYVDIWDGGWVAADLPVLGERIKAGQRIWYCGGLGAVGNPVVDSRAYGARSWAWVGWKYHFEGFEMWQSIYWLDKYNVTKEEKADFDRNPDKYINVWKNPAPLTFDEARKRPGHKRMNDDILQNGGAVFFYPGQDIGLPDEIVPSLRLKDFRRGEQDYEYLWLLDKAGEKKLVEEAVGAIYLPEAVTLVRGGSPKVKTGDLGVTMDEGVWESVRRKLGERLNALPDGR